jgi:serine/threonine protein kinase
VAAGQRSDLVPGDRLDKYRLERLLGRGGMGEVWAAHDPDLDRRIALKVLRPALAAAEDARARLQREGRAMARLRHPNVITVHDATFSGDRGLIAMELVDGESLAAWLTRRRPPAEVVRVLLAAGRGVAAAHAAEMIHRDFKPHNVLVDRDGRVVVTDFGLARSASDAPADAAPPEPPPAPRAQAAALDATATPTAHPEHALAAGERASRDAGAALDETATPDAALDETAATGDPIRSPPSAGDLSTPLTVTGELIGTPAYMAPEQLAGRPADARSDQFAFCVTAWEAFAGERPFRGKSFEELVASVGRGDPGPGERIPRRLRPLILRGLARDPAARWPSMERLLVELDRAWRRPRRLAIAGGVLAGVAALAIAFVIASREETRAIPGCGESSAELAPAWSPAIRARLEAKITDEGRRADVLRYFERWSTTWRELHGANCAAPAAPEFAARHECLTAIRDELAIAQAADSDVIGAVFSEPNNLRYMPDPDLCRRAPRAAAPPSPPPAVRDRVNALRVAMLGRALHDASDPRAMIDEARATGYGPVLAEAMLLDATVTYLLADTELARGEACSRYSAVEAQAESASHGRMLVEALLRHYQCASDLDRRAEARLLYERLDTTARRSATRYQLAALGMITFLQTSSAGRLNDGIAAAREGAALYAELGDPRWAAIMGYMESLALFARHRGDDLERAEALIRTVLALRPPLDSARPHLHTVLWHLGRPEAASLPAADPEVPDPIDVTVQVVDGAAPVGGADVAAAARLHADATRVAMTELGPAATATTGPDGAVRLRAPRHGVILARAGDRVGAVAVPARPGVVVIRLGAAAAVAGAVAGLVEYPDTDPSDRAGRARYHWLPRVGIAAEVDGRPVVWVAPVGVDGRWRLPPVVLPGRHRLILQVESHGEDEYVVQAPIELRPGDNVAGPIALPGERRLLDLVLRPGIPANAIAYPATAGPAPSSWARLDAALAAAPLVTAALGSPGEVSEGAQPTDVVARLAIGGDGPVVVCVLAGTALHDGVPVWRVERDAATPPPRCQRVDPDPATITRLVLDPTKPTP